MSFIDTVDINNALLCEGPLLVGLGLLCKSSASKLRCHRTTPFLLLYHISLQIGIGQVFLAEDIQVCWFLEANLTHSIRHLMLLGCEVFASRTGLAIVSFVKCIIERWS